MHAVRGPAVRAIRECDHLGVELTVVRLPRVVATTDEQIECDTTLTERRQLARCGREEPARARGVQRGHVAGDKEHQVVPVEWQRPARQQLRPDDGDRALACCVDVYPTAPRLAEPLGVHVETELSELRFRPAPELVVTEHGEELAAAGEPRDLARNHRTAARGHGQHLLALHDRARRGRVRDEDEVNPFDMTDDGAAHRGIIAEYGGRVRAVLWDFDGTLAFRTGRWAGLLAEVLDDHEPGHGFAADDFRPFLRNGFPWHRPDVPHPELTAPGAWWAAVESLLSRAYEGVGYASERAAALAKHAGRRYADPTRGWELYDDVLPALRRLRTDGWRHVILSNHIPELPAIVEHLGLVELVDVVISSAITGFEKPHPEAFEAGRRAAGADELWMVGDNPIADVRGAEAVGIPAILVRSTPLGTERHAETVARAAELISHATRSAR